MDEIYLFSEFNSMVVKGSQNINNGEGYLNYRGYKSSWTSFFFTGWKNSALVKRAYNFFLYYLKHSEQVPYLLIELAVFFGTYKVNGINFSKYEVDPWIVTESYVRFNIKEYSINDIVSNPFKIDWRKNYHKHITKIEKYIEKQKK